MGEGKAAVTGFYREAVQTERGDERLSTARQRAWCLGVGQVLMRMLTQGLIDK